MSKKRDYSWFKQLHEVTKPSATAEAQAVCPKCKGLGSQPYFLCSCTIKSAEAPAADVGEPFKMPTITTWQERVNTSGRRECESLGIEMMEAEIADLRAAVAEWEKLCNPVALHANLMRGIPAKLTTEMLRHLAGDYSDAACASRPVPQASESRGLVLHLRSVSRAGEELTRQAADRIEELEAALAAKSEQPQAGASELPPLPKGEENVLVFPSTAIVFTADQMRDYAKAAIEANERDMIVFGGKRMGRNYLAGLEADKKRLDALTEESWQLDPTTLPTGGDDADIGWRVRQYYMGEVEPRTVAEVFEDSPRKAIDAAIASQGTEQGGAK